jgi:hypothetical protein
MCDRHPTESANDFVTATLAIPSHAIRVIAAPPDTISQKNVEAATGVTARVYLESIRDPNFPIPVTGLGKLRIVNRVAFITWLEKGAFGKIRKIDQCDAAVEELDNEHDEERANGILNAIGLHPPTAKINKRKSSAMR